MIHDWEREEREFEGPVERPEHSWEVPDEPSDPEVDPEVEADPRNEPTAGLMLVRFLLELLFYSKLSGHDFCVVGLEGWNLRSQGILPETWITKWTLYEEGEVDPGMARQREILFVRCSRLHQA
eukprot:982630-Karenia_brevis.AAC.2